jgi:hypothetical protein
MLSTNYALFPRLITAAAAAAAVIWKEMSIGFYLTHLAQCLC